MPLRAAREWVALSELTRARVRISGRVQGVFFRAETRDRAHSLGLSGWVRNAHDGSVEGAFEGPADRVRSMLDWCNHGPRLASVDEMAVDWEKPRGERGFEIR